MREQRLKREDLNDDETAVRLYRSMVDPDTLEKFDAGVVERRKAKQWEAGAMISKIEKATEPFRRKQTGYIGIVERDIYSADYNYVFGWSRKNHALVSLHRFTAVFHDVPPKRGRLHRRALMQLLSSAGPVFGVPRCTDPTCGRAYPESVEEHDAKEPRLCSDCKSGFKKAKSRK